jgi:hypothetical protein
MDGLGNLIGSSAELTHERTHLASRKLMSDNYALERARYGHERSCKGPLPRSMANDRVKTDALRSFPHVNGRERPGFLLTESAGSDRRHGALNVACQRL